MPPATFKYDDTFSFVRPVQDGRTQVAYPFLSNGDRGSCTYSRTLLQRAANYVPAVLGFERDSVWEDGDPAAYLISETSPEPAGVGDLMRFTRTYARLPGQQTVYSSRLIDRPIMHDITASGYYAVSFDNGITSHVFTARKSVTAVGAITPAGATEANAANGLPTVTVTVANTGGSSTTFSTADSAATIQSTLLTFFSGAIQVAKGASRITASGTGAMATSMKYVDASGGALDASYSTDGTNAELSISATDRAVDVNPDTPTNIRTLTSAAHGGAVGDLLAVWNGDKLLGTTKVLAVTTDTVTIRADQAPWAIGSLAVTHLQFADTSSARYVNGPANCTVKEVTDFYLPGVSSGITTPADIALVAPKLDPVSWLTAIQAATAYVVIEGSQLSRWLGGPIYQQTTISVQMSDALDTVAVAA